MKTTELLLLLAALALAPALCPAPAGAQLGSRPEEQVFDYDPGAEKTAKLQKFSAEVTYEDAEAVTHPVYGTYMVSKFRWKNWVTRALYLTLVNIGLIAVLLSLSKTEEYTLVISYVLAGMSATLSFWAFLCAVLIYKLNSNAWLYVLPAALVTGGAGYLALLKIKKSDISLSELKESFQKMRAANNEDPRLASVPGSPGDWPNEDFIK